MRVNCDVGNASNLPVVRTGNSHMRVNCDSKSAKNRN